MSLSEGCTCPAIGNPWYSHSRTCPIRTGTAAAVVEQASMAQPPAPVQRPTLPGMVEGIVSLDPLTIQCRGCGVVDTSGSLRVREDRVAMVIILSSIRFHSTVWTTGHTDNPRLCRACRQARGCQCESCQFERRG